MKKIFTSLFSLFLLFGAMNAVAAEYPFKVTTDAENPELYAIQSGRGAAYWWTFNPTDATISLAAYTYFDAAQYWYFTEVTEGETTYLQLHPYLGEGKAMGYKDTAAGHTKVWAVTPGEEGYDCRWIFDNNGGNAPYGLKPTSNNIYLSNYGGAQYKMGFWTTGPAGDGGTAMYFERVSKDPQAYLNAQNNMMGGMQEAYGLATTLAQLSSNAPQNSEGSLAALIDNNYTTFFHSAWQEAYRVNEKHYLQIEVKQPIENFCFYFKKRDNNNNNRPTDMTILGSADGVEYAEIANITSGFPTSGDVVDYMSEIYTLATPYKYFRFVVNATNNNAKNGDYPFFTYSEFYLFPGEQAIRDAYALTNAFIGSDEYFDQFVAAYRKVQADKVARIFAETVAEAEALLAAAAENHVENPALGQYSTAAYTALEAAAAEVKADDSPTQEALDALSEAIKAFHMAKNMPVFTINGVFSYAQDKYIYDNNSGTLYFNKNKDLADETMLWAFDMDTTAVGVAESVVVRNVATGNLFWNSASIKVTETSDANAEDGRFCFYVDHQYFPIHARQSDNAVITWNTNLAESASAWVFTYVGTTYDLYDLDATAWNDVTADYVKSADLASAEGWVATGGGYAHVAGDRVAEFYAGWDALVNINGSLLQEVVLPAGTYRLTGKAFYRAGFAFDSNRETSLGYLVAGDNKVAVKTLAGEEVEGAYANSIGEASAAFYNADLYDNVLEFTLAEETTLNLGFECAHEQGYSWFIVGEVKLERAEAVPGALKAEFEAKAMEFCQYNNMAMYSLQGVMARWEEKTATVMNVYETIYSGGKILDAKVKNLIKEMTDMLVEFDAISEYFAEFNEVKYSCFDLQDNSGDNTDAEVIAAFDEAVSSSYNTSSIATLADLKALTEALVAARNQYVLNAVPNEGYAFDYTFLIEGIGNSTNGWALDIKDFVGNFVYKHSTEMNTDELQKTGFIEAWNPAPYAGTISYTKNEIRNGYYKISAFAFNDDVASFFANDKSVAIANTKKYENPVLDSVMVINGTLKFGLNVEHAWWVGITNVELAFVGEIPDSILYGTQRAEFVAKAHEFAAFVEGNPSLTSMNGIKGTYAWPIFDVIDPLVADINNVTDMALLVEQIAAMDEAMAVMAQAIDVYEAFRAIVDCLWDADENSVALTQDVADAKDMALQNSNYVGMMAATVEELEAALEAAKEAYFAYITNAVANEGYKFNATFMIANPSFETGDLTGWEVKNANDTGVRENSNGTYSMSNCDGEYVFNTWHGAGIYVQQVVKDLPAGVYALNTVLASDAQMLLDVTAGNKTIQHSCVSAKEVGDEVVVDSIVHEGGDFLIKVATVDNEWGWFKADNFRLYCLGAEAPVEVETVTLNMTEVTLDIVGDSIPTVQLVATVAPADAADQTITWTSSNEEVATVDADGVVTAVAEGTATITATAANGVSAECVVTVTFTAGIVNIEAVENNVIYTVTGKAVQGSLNSLERGIYIVNGKKVYVK